MDRLLESLELDGRANGRRDTSDYDDNSVEGRRCFSRMGISLIIFIWFNRIGTVLDCRDHSITLLEINGLIELEWPALDCGNHSRIIGLDWNHRLYRIGMASTLQGPSER